MGVLISDKRPRTSAAVHEFESVEELPRSYNERLEM